MGEIFTYLLYAFAFIAVVLAVEGLWFSLRSHLGDERRVNRRLGVVRLEETGSAKKDRPASAFERWVQKNAPRLAVAIRRAHVPIGAAKLVLAAAALGLAVTIALTLATAPLLLAILAGFALAVAAPAGLIAFFASRRRKRFLVQFPQAVDLIARSLQVGHPVTTAMTVVAQQMSDPLGSEFGLVMEEITYGLDRDAALENLVRRFPLPEVRMFVASMQITRETGGNLSEVFLKLSESIRVRSNLRKKVEAVSAEGRLTFWVVSGLPIFVGGALVLLRPGFYGDVIGDPLFWPMMSVAPITLAIGSAIIWRLVNVRI